MSAVHKLLDGALTALGSASMALAPANVWVGLFTGITDNGADTLMADLALPTGDLALRVNVASWGTPYHLNDGSAVMDGGECTFTLGGTDSATTIRGYYLGDASVGGNLLLFNYFANPIPVPDTHHPITVVPRVSAPASGAWDVSQSWDS